MIMVWCTLFGPPIQQRHYYSNLSRRLLLESPPQRALLMQSLHHSTCVIGFVVILAVHLSVQSYAMRIVVQRVKSASVTVEGKKVSSIGQGIMALVGIHENDDQADLDYCCKRLLGCKLWENDGGALWRQGVKQKGYQVLCVSQFTLYGTLTKKNQPDYKGAMKAIPAQELYNAFLVMLRVGYEQDKIFDGIFGALMEIELVNDGPVTIVIESGPRAPADDNGQEDGEHEVR
jgi:D-aminoacyl-tRNA deacylase